MEVREAGFALDFVDSESDFAEGMVLIFLEVCEGDFEYSACLEESTYPFFAADLLQTCIRTLQAVVRILHATASVDECLPDIADLESRWSLNIVPWIELIRALKTIHRLATEGHLDGNQY